MIPEFNDIIPDNPNKAYDMYEVIIKIADTKIGKSFLPSLFFSLQKGREFPIPFLYFTLMGVRR